MHPRPSYKHGSVLAVVGVLLAMVAIALLFRGPEALTIGMEGRYEVALPDDALAAVPYTHGDALAVRIAAAVPADNGVRYDLRYMAYGPGKHDLREYLIDERGKRPATLPEMVVTVEPLLPDDYSGKLFDAPRTPIDLNSNYRLGMMFLWGAWGLLLIPLALYGRRRRVQALPTPPPPTIPERLRQLLETAELEALSPVQQADLEKLLLAFWAERLNVPAGRLVETLRQLRDDPQAGPQVRHVEQWLHGRRIPGHSGVPRELLLELGWKASEKRRGMFG